MRGRHTERTPRMSRWRAARLVVVAAVAAGALAPAQAQAQPAQLRIMLTNDDGYPAPGLRLVFDRLTAAGYDVTIVAPDTNQSGVGTKVGLTPQITVKHPSAEEWAVSGTPSDSVSFGLRYVFKDKAPDLVVSGTNA